MVEAQAPQELVQQAIVELPGPTRALVLLFYFDDLSYVKEARRMIELSVADVRTIQYKDREGRECENCIVIPLEREGRRALTVVMCPAGGDAIAYQLSNQQLPRPLTTQLAANLLAAASATVARVVVSELKDETFCARVHLRAQQHVVEVDARSSDAIARALHAGAPIYVDESVMAKAGIEVPGSEQALLDEAIRTIKGGGASELKTKRVVAASCAL